MKTFNIKPLLSFTSALLILLLFLITRTSAENCTVGFDYCGWELLELDYYDADFLVVASGNNAKYVDGAPEHSLFHCGIDYGLTRVDEIFTKMKDCHSALSWVKYCNYGCDKHMQSDCAKKPRGPPKPSGLANPPMVNPPMAKKLSAAAEMDEIKIAKTLDEKATKMKRTPLEAACSAKALEVQSSPFGGEPAGGWGPVDISSAI
ncbi:MAG: hypothetical protein Q9219_000412 [cf. Caloplaca sp. 3 TL-2023]